MGTQRLLGSLPSVDELLKSPEGAEWQASAPRRYVVQAIREMLDHYRQAILQGELTEVPLDTLRDTIDKRVRQLSAFSLQPVINATGVVIHTNLGRSVLPQEVLERVREIASGYSNLEYDLEKGRRGKRYSHVQRLLTDTTGAESGLIVNNNAAAVLVCLNALAQGKEVVVSRGELVEIGGSFRVPDVMAGSGAILREVGTTNKTHLYDYERAINENTALLLKVHQSNFTMVGFTEAVSLEDLVALGRKHNIPVMFDWGSGCLVDLKPYGIHSELTIQEIIRAGVDIVTFSGDKLLGGPQGGVIVGKAALIEKIARNPLMRAVRIDKLTLAAFEATLMYYLDESSAKEKIPTLSMLLQGPAKIKKRAENIVSSLKKEIEGKDALSIEVRKDVSPSGGGALPGMEFETYVVALKPATLSVNALEERLRKVNPPIIARIKEDTLLLDARTVSDHEIADLVRGIKEALSE